MKHFLWNHKATILTAPPQLFQTLLPITNVEEAKTIKRLIQRFNEVGIAGEFWLFRKRGRKRKVAHKVGGLEP
jgi:hypothetical protein